MKTVISCPLLTVSNQSVIMPIGAKLLSVDWVSEQLTLAIVADQGNPSCAREIEMLVDGRNLVGEMVYVDSVVVAGESKVLHVFDRGEHYAQ